jgi:hypothetical protein
VAGNGSCRVAEHCQTCTKHRTGAVGFRAALESAVQLDRCDEVNRQAQMANSTKCRDSLQPCMAMALSCVLTPLVHAACSRDLWSFAGLHPPKMQTFAGSHSNAAYGPSCTRLASLASHHVSISATLDFSSLQSR